MAAFREQLLPSTSVRSSMMFHEAWIYFTENRAVAPLESRSTRIGRGRTQVVLRQPLERRRPTSNSRNRPFQYHAHTAAGICHCTFSVASKKLTPRCTRYSSGDIEPIPFERDDRGRRRGDFYDIFTPEKYFIGIPEESWIESHPEKGRYLTVEKAIFYFGSITSGSTKATGAS